MNVYDIRTGKPIRLAKVYDFAKAKRAKRGGSAGLALSLRAGASSPRTPPAA